MKLIVKEKCVDISVSEPLMLLFYSVSCQKSKIHLEKE